MKFYIGTKEVLPKLNNRFVKKHKELNYITNKLNLSNISSGTVSGITLTKINNNRFILNGTCTESPFASLITSSISVVNGHTYAAIGINFYNGEGYYVYYPNMPYVEPSKDRLYVANGTGTAYFYLRIKPRTVNNVEIMPMIFDLTEKFGAGNEPTLEEFQEMLPSLIVV